MTLYTESIDRNGYKTSDYVVHVEDRQFVSVERLRLRWQLSRRQGQWSFRMSRQAMNQNFRRRRSNFRRLRR